MNETNIKNSRKKKTTKFIVRGKSYSVITPNVIQGKSEGYIRRRARHAWFQYPQERNRIERNVYKA